MPDTETNELYFYLLEELSGLNAVPDAITLEQLEIPLQKSSYSA